MIMQNKIDIHEFSTGIEVKGTPNGWESGGFTGEYMNRTIDPIPQAVLDSIANRQFALAEGVVTADPAMVGRVVRGYGEIWSVVAVVTRGRDDRGRGVSLYRYFLSQGDGRIETILLWMGKPRVFNPFDRRDIGQPHQANLSPKEVRLTEEFREMLNQSLPILVPNEKPCAALRLNEMTRNLPPNDDRAWAYKVAMLERPEYFQVIYPADDQAEMVIREVLNRRQSLPVLTSGESGIKTAIKAVTNVRVRREHIETLENALGNSQLNDKYWESILDKEGASQAFRENLYGDRYVRLLTLKAMLIPQFLPYFLDWLAESKEWKTHYATSLSLQKWMLREAPKFTDDFSNLSERLKFGICYVIDCLVDEPQILKQSQLLLTDSGLWSQLYQKSLSKELEAVLSLMGNYIEKRQKQNLQSLRVQYPQWSRLLNKINKFWYPPEQHDPNYKSLAKLFEKVGTARLVAIFYQIGEGSVPKPLFDKLSTNKSEIVLFKKKIYRRKNLGDRAKELTEEVYFFFCGTVDIGGINMSRFMALIILLAVFTGGFALGIIVRWPSLIAGSETAQIQPNNTNNNNNQQSNNANNSNNQQSTSEPTPVPNNNNNEGDQGKRVQASPSPEYNMTNSAIEAIVDDLKGEIELQVRNFPENPFPQTIKDDFYKEKSNINSKGIVISCIKDKLGLPTDFQYGDVGKEEQKWAEFSTAIREYQLRKGARSILADGVISLKNATGKDKGQTRKWLEEDIRECLELSESQSNQPRTPDRIRRRRWPWEIN
ncbi:hypothetical protein [Okeania sp. SIO1I7]|uniref:hypothetical protein n=1 Tax=Okeania sp. SIO1I7 TaxID=2607772 RepID=UPI0013FA2E13|nr:hypothetical protein [Okeania sp. SIO1I7]NET30025.1 hypothetical protein [Okeania sp. SIO1I7]